MIPFNDAVKVQEICPNGNDNLTYVISLIIGTTAELIKMAPVVHELKQRDVSCEIWWTGMHNKGIEPLFDQLGIPAPVLTLGGKKQSNVNSTFEAIFWFGQVSIHSLLNSRKLKARLRHGDFPTVLVHGDTFSTVIGSALGRLLGAKVMHVEAGYRSGSLRAPFPEEINRIIAAKMSHVHFAPGQLQADNLAAENGVVINTEANTAIDALREVAKLPTPQNYLDARPYGVVTLHRFEFLSNDELVTSTIKKLIEISSQLKLFFFTGSHDQARFADLGLLDNLPDSFVVQDKLRHADFIPVVQGASAIITDSGGLQQESNYLGIPALIHRERTEHQAGIGTTAILSKLDISTFDEFISTYENLRGPNLVDTYHPSKTIAEYIASYIDRT